MHSWRAASHVVFPGLRSVVRDADGTFSLYNPAHGTSIDVEAESAALVSDLLAAFETPRTVDSLLAAEPDLPEDLLLLLVRSGFVVEESELSFLAQGFLRPTTAPVGQPVGWSDLPELPLHDAWAVLGVPTDAGALGAGGARHGPSEIRKYVSGPLIAGEGDVVDHDFDRIYPSLRPRVVDLGDVDPEGGRLEHVGMRMRKVLRELFAQGVKPLVLGGDHTVTHFALEAAMEAHPRFGIIHFDAHHDLTPSVWVSHANVFRAALASERVANLVQIGLRVIERMPVYATRTPCPKRKVVSARQAAAGKAHALLAALPRDLPYYLSVDIDCIDGAVVRETGTPEPGGLSVSLATELVDLVARSFTLIGADFVEVAGPRGGTNQAATIAASLLQRCVIGDAPFEPLTGDVYL
ncbi:MAG: arginase family protein [Polyangiales bacterium]